MLERQIQIPGEVDFENITTVVDDCAARLGLRITRVGSLATFPGSRHWHLQRDQAGTLEVTVWPSRRRMWLNVHANRDGGWATGAMESLARAIEEGLLAMLGQTD